MRGRTKEQFNIEQLAADPGVSKRTLEMRFRASVETPPHQFLTRLRVQHAEALFGNGGGNIRMVVADGPVGLEPGHADLVVAIAAEVDPGLPIVVDEDARIEEPAILEGLHAGSFPVDQAGALQTSLNGPGRDEIHGPGRQRGERGAIELRLDKPDGKLIGTCKVPNTGDVQTWTSADCAVTEAKGEHDLHLRFVGSGDQTLFKLDWWQFQ